MKKRLIPLFLAVFLLLTCLPTAMATTTPGGDGDVGGEIFDGASAKITLTDAEAEPGQTVTIPVTISANPGFSGLKLTFTYNNAYLTLDSIRPTTKLTGGTWTCNPETAQALWISDADTTKTGEVLYLDFTLSEKAPAGTYKVGITVDGMVNAALTNLTVTATGASITSGAFKWQMDIRSLTSSSVTVRVTNQDPAAKKALVLWAAYDSSNKLLVSDIYAADVSSGTDDVRLSIDTANMSHGKILLLDPTTYAPLTDALCIG